MRGVPSLVRRPACARRAPALLAGLLVAAVAAPPAAAALAGRVVSAADGRPVEGARVRVVETGEARRTDAAGRFAFPSLPAGTWTLAVHHVAIADVERVVRADGGADSVTLVAPPALHPTDEIVVRSARTLALLRASPDAGEAWDAGRLGRVPAPGVAEALAAMPGLALARDGAWETAVSIRGLGGPNVVTLVDDARLEAATDVAGALSLVDVAELERVEVVKSPGSVLFGSGAFGGAVHLVTRRPAFAAVPAWSAEWTGGLTAVDRGAAQHLAVEAGAGRAAVRASAGLRRAQAVRTPAGPLPDSHWGDGSGAVTLALRPRGEQTLLASWQRVAARDAGIPGGSPFAATAEARYTRAARERFGLEYRVPNAWARVPLLAVRASRQVITREVELRLPSARVTPHAVHTVTGAQLEARVRPARRHVLLAGVDAWRRALDSRRERRPAAGAQVIGERPVPPASYRSAGLWLRHEWASAGERVRVVTGVRGDLGRVRNEPALQPDYVIDDGTALAPVPGQFLLWPAGTAHDASWSASTGAHVTLTPAWSASAQLATAFRAPSLEERFQYLDLGSLVRLGNPALAPERGLSLDVGTRLEGRRTRVRADVFGTRLRDLVADTPGTWEGRPATLKANLGRARTYGFELSAEHAPHRRVVLSAALAYVRGEDAGAHRNLAQVAPLSGHAGLAFELPAAGTFRIDAAAAHAQGNPGPGETATAGWSVWGASFASRAWHAAGARARLGAGVTNALDRAYRLHLSTLRGTPALEPGRGAWASLTLGFASPGAR